MLQTGRGSVLLTTTIGSFLTAFMGSALNIALPAISKEFGMDAVLLGWVATSFVLAVAVFLVPFGRLADIHGRKRVFTYGVFLFLVTTAILIRSSSSAMLIGVRVVQGIGSAMIFATSSAILSSAYPPGERGRVLGINVAAVYIGLSAGPFLGGVLTQNFGWRSIFVAGTVLGIIAAGAAVQLKAEWAAARGEAFDWVGSIIYGAAISILMFGLSRLPAAEGGILLAAGAAGLVGFAAWENHSPAPVLSLDMFRRNRAFTFSSLAALVNYLATTAVAFLLSLYLQYIGGFTAQQAGLILVAQPLVQALCSPLAGRLSDRVESRIVASLGMALTAGGLLMLIFLSRNTPLSYVIAALLLLGVGFGIFSSPNMNAIMGSSDQRNYGVASALLSTMRTLGQMLGMGATLLIFSLVIGPVEISPPYYDAFLTSTHIAFSISTGLCILGIFASLARGNVRQNGRV